jgi:hypothetical protein
VYFLTLCQRREKNVLTGRELVQSGTKLSKRIGRTHKRRFLPGMEEKKQRIFHKLKIKTHR